MTDNLDNWYGNSELLDTFRDTQRLCCQWCLPKASEPRGNGDARPRYAETARAKVSFRPRPAI